MFISEFVCGILATIGVEFLLLVGYAVFMLGSSVSPFSHSTDTL